MYLKTKLACVCVCVCLLSACSVFKNGFLGLAPMGDRQEYVRARNLYDAQKYQEAVKELSNYIYKAGNVKRREARAYRLLGRSYEQLGQLGKALETYLEALEFHPDNIPLLLAAANLYQRTGLTDKSQQLYERVLQLEPASREALAGQAENYCSFGFYSQAHAYYDRFLALTPSPEPYHRARYARILLHQRLFEPAFIQITQALAQDNTQPDYWLISAKAAHGLGRTQEALANVQSAMLLAPQRTDLQLYRLILLYQDAQYAASLEQTRQFLNENPQNALGLLLAALNEHKLGHPARARNYLTQCVQVADEKSFTSQVAHQLLQLWK